MKNENEFIGLTNHSVTKDKSSMSSKNQSFSHAGSRRQLIIRPRPLKNEILRTS